MVAVVIVASLISAIGCTRAMLISDDEWGQQGMDYKGGYLIRTIDGREIRAMRIAKKDSSLIISEYRDSAQVGDSRLEIPETNIESIKKTKIWWFGTILGITAFGGVCYFAWMIALGKGLSHWEN